MKSKISKSKTTIPSPFDTVITKTEWTCAAKIAEWINEIVKSKTIPLGKAEVETTTQGNRKRADIIIFESTISKKIICSMEMKQPYLDVFSFELKDDARKKANRRKAKYFCTSNFKKLIWWKTKEANDPTLSEEQQIIEKYDLSKIENLDDIEQTKYCAPIKDNLEKFLIQLYAVHTGKEPEPKQAVDELLIYRIHEKIRILSNYYKRIITDRCHKDSDFTLKFSNWFTEQNWNFTWSEEDFDKASRQTAYLLVNKILFYNLLQTKRPHDLSPLEIPKGLNKGGQLQKILQSYFDEVLKIDYETIYTTDFIDTIAFPESEEVVSEIRELILVFKLYDLSKLGFEIIGRIFERIIPPEERHNLGQYFTNADIVDIILKFCLRHENDKVLDPSCGAGTFLVRAYHYKKLMNQNLEHEKILEDLWGNDIAKFPAHLSTINLSIKDLSIDNNYPNIIKEDFFNLKVGSKGFDLPEDYRKRLAVTLGKSKKEITYPRWFDTIVGNPPYIRQEEIPETGVDKEKLIENALKVGSEKIADISKRSGIHSYFFVHGTKFLIEGGTFGFIVSNSWLDVDFGKGLQEFFLKNYKIITIIDSKVERWFYDADINTCIIILEKCKDKKQRDDNLVRFVYLKKPISKFIPVIEDIWEKQIIRLNKIDKFKKTILAHNNFYENDDLKIYPKLQSELWDEGYDDEEKKYLGSTWGKYLRAPEVFFKVLEKKKNKFTFLRKFTEIRRGITSGVNSFFYLRKEEFDKFEIENKYLKPIIFSLKEIKGYELNKKSLDKKVLICHDTKDKLKGTNVLRYIKYGERKGYNKRPTCKQRKPNPWYSLAMSWKYAPIIFPAKVGERMPVILNKNVFEDKKLYGIFPNNKKDTKLIAALLNSTLSRFYIEFTCRQLTGSQPIADIDVKVVKNLKILNINKISENNKTKILNCYQKLLKTNSESIFIEIGDNPENISLIDIKKERRELDKIIMKNVLHLTEKEQLEIYKSVIDVVKSRIEKAKSLNERKKINNGIDLYAVKKLILDKVKEL